MPLPLSGMRESRSPRAGDVVPPKASALEGRQQLRNGDSAVDRILAVIAGIVPATGNIEAIGAGPVAIERFGGVTSQATDGFVAVVRCDTNMAGGPRIGLAGDIAADLDAAALRIEPGERVNGETAIEIVGDRKAVARPVAGDQTITVTGNGIGGKIRHMRPDAGGRIKPARPGHSLADDDIAGIDKLEGYGAACVRDHRRPLRTVGEIAELVHPDDRPTVRPVGGSWRCGNLHQ